MGIPEGCAVLGSAPCALGATASRVGVNLTATRRCDTTTSANISDGRSGYCAPPCFKTTPGTPARKNERREKRRREHTTERQARRPSRGSWNVTPAAWKKQSGQGWVTRRSGLLALWPSGSGTGSCLQTRNLSMSFSEVLVATCGVQTLERPKHNSSRHATSSATTEACIIGHAGRATLSPAPANCVLLLLSLVLLPVRSCPSARAEDLT